MTIKLILHRFETNFENNPVEMLVLLQHKAGIDADFNTDTRLFEIPHRLLEETESLHYFERNFLLAVQQLYAAVEVADVSRAAALRHDVGQVARLPRSQPRLLGEALDELHELQIIFRSFQDLSIFMN